MATYIPNPKRLPADNLHTFSFSTDAAAEKKATEYQSAWIYKSRFVENLVYLYVLDSEWQEKQQEKKQSWTNTKS